MIRAWLRRRPIIHSMVLAAILSLLTGTAVTVQSIATGDIGFDRNLCVEGQGYPEFGNVSWYKEGYDCPLQWGSILNAVIMYSAAYSPLYFIWMAFYVMHREAFRAWLRRQPIIHSAALTVVLTTLTAVLITAYLTAGGGVGSPPSLCWLHKGYTGFGDIPRGDGIYCTPQWEAVFWAHISVSIIFSTPFVIWMVFYIVHRFAVARQARREAEQARAGPR